MHIVGVLKVQAILHFDLMVVRVVGDVGFEDYMLVAVLFKVFSGDVVIVCQHEGVFFVDVFCNCCVQHCVVHKAGAGDGGEETLIVVLNHTEDACLVFGVLGLVIATTFEPFSGQTVIYAGQKDTATETSLDAIALKADGKLHFVNFNLTAQFGPFLIYGKHIQKFMSPVECGLNADVAAFRTFSQCFLMKGHFDELTPGLCRLPGPGEGSICARDKLSLAGLAQIALRSSVPTAFNDEAEV